MNANTNIMNANTTEERERVIPTNWICEGCPHFDMGARWHSRGACLAPVEEIDGTMCINEKPCLFALYDGIETPLCSLISVIGFVIRYCEDDERYHLRGDYAYANDGCYYSTEYAQENFYHCEQCGDYIVNPWDYDRELHMCSTCAEEYYREQNRIIGDWHEHKGCFETVTASAHDDTRYTLGFEMEVEGCDRDHETTAHMIDDTFPRAFVFEYDCSLYDGFEIISQPHTLEAFEALDLERLERLLVNEDYGETDDADTTGLHVHFSTAFLGDTEDERVHTFARLVRFYDANFNALCAMVDRKDVGHSYRNCDENRPYNESDYFDDYELTEAQVNGSRYVAINGDRFYRGTFEVRLCDGTIKAEKVRAWVDFNIALMECLQKNNTTDIADVVPYMSDRAVNFFADSL